MSAARRDIRVPWLHRAEGRVGLDGDMVTIEVGDRRQMTPETARDLAALLEDRADAAEERRDGQGTETDRVFAGGESP